MSNSNTKKEEYRNYLFSIPSRRGEKLTPEKVSNYVDYIERNRLFNNKKELTNKFKKDIYDISDNSPQNIDYIERILNDDDFKKLNENNNKGVRKTSLNHYKEFLNYLCNNITNAHKKKKNNNFGPRQQIFFGAPGTGKSYTIKKKTERCDVIRTTFHPDSDYSTFVGAYKPTMKEEDVMTINGTTALQVTKADNTQYKETKIVYKFVPQAFLKAYFSAWEKYAKDKSNPAPQFLVIEEINRGNCAQIFGDIFQLLDRNDDGYSEYPINADKDIETYLAHAFKNKNITIPNNKELDPNIANKISLGKILLLPPNLYIWATMNTSDQSLFPIDSAFKRRWDWKYVPISEASLKWKLKVNNKTYDWWKFVQAINEQIGGLTRSQDKKLGYFFCKAKNGVIDAETLVGKVFFFLWNEILKDFQEDQDFLNDGKGGTLEFDNFYAFDARGEIVVKEDKVEQLLTNLKLEPLSTEDGSQQLDEGQDNNKNETQHTDETNA